MNIDKMKKFPILLLAALIALPAAISFSSCSTGDDENSQTTWDKYENYRNTNLNWLAQEETRLDKDGNPFYERLTAPWNSNSYILIHWFNDRAKTAGNIQPLLTSTVRTHYVCRNYMYNVVDADSTSVNGTYFAVNGVVDGWQLALQNMHVGDSVQIVLPYQMGYGNSTSMSSIPPYSALQFNLGLKDCVTYEVRP